MSLEFPIALLGLVVVPFVLWSMRTQTRARRQRLVEICGRHPRRQRRAAPFVLAALVCAIVSLAQPSWGFERRSIEQRGVDLWICLDVSRSMLARDLAPSRLRRAQAELHALAKRVRGDRLGLVAFAGEATLTVPLTQDASTFAELVDQADPLTVRKGGTDLGAAVDTALAALGDDERHAAIVLLTDGEDHEHRGLRAAERCNQRSVPVHCIGFGSPLGSKITLEDGRGGAFLRDRDGDDVVSRMNERGLRAIADAAGGVFLDASASPHPLLELYARHILPMARQAVRSSERPRRQSRFQWFLAAGLAFAVVGLATQR